jgi:hypothetical protein
MEGLRVVEMPDAHGQFPAALQRPRHPAGFPHPFLRDPPAPLQGLRRESS